MKETLVKEMMKVEPRTPILIEGLPGLGVVGKIVVRYLTKQLKAQRFAELYSPHFPYYVLVNKKGNVRLLRGEFYLWKDQRGENDLVLLSGDSQAQTIEGQYEVANCILDYATKIGTKLIITVGGFRKETEDSPKVMAVSTSPELLGRALKAQAISSPPGNPIVGTAGLLLGLARFRDIDALCLLGETHGYLPDPKAAKSVIEVLQRLLNIQVDENAINTEIKKAKKIAARMQEIEAKRESYARRMRRTEEERMTYIS